MSTIANLPQELIELNPFLPGITVKIWNIFDWYKGCLSWYNESLWLGNCILRGPLKLNFAENKSFYGLNIAPKFFWN